MPDRRAGIHDELLSVEGSLHTGALYRDCVEQTRLMPLRGATGAMPVDQG
jgi:hypothetical protein